VKENEKFVAEMMKKMKMKNKMQMFKSY